MLSLDKTKSHAGTAESGREIMDFYRGLDGLTVVLTYKGGELVAVTERLSRLMHVYLSMYRSISSRRAYCNRGRAVITYEISIESMGNRRCRCSI